MTPTLTIVVYMTILTWLTVVIPGLLRVRIWTGKGIVLAMGNRDTLPDATSLAGRAERTGRNTMENFVVFAALALVAHGAGISDPMVAQGATLFFWARVVYVPVYYAGIIGVRTVVWAVGTAGLVMMFVPLLK